MVFSLDLLEEVVVDLEQHEQSRRIKKLFFCISKNYWENDANVLARFPLGDLIRETLQLKDLDDISIALNEIVESLNRQEVYAAIANDIIDSLSILFPEEDEDEDEATRILIQPKKIVPQKPLIPGLYLDKIVSNIQNHREGDRLKKLIFSAYQNHWESNMAVIDRYDLKDLILQLRRNYPNLEGLKHSLYSLVESLNRKEVYTLLADLIISRLEITYQQPNSQEETHLITQMVSAEEIAAVRQAANNSKYESENGFDFSQIMSREEMTEVEQKNIAYSQLASTEMSEIEAEIEAEIKLEIEPERDETENNNLEIKQPDYDNFELRLKIIQYTNPFRAKNLLYSAIYGRQFSDREQSLSVLKTYTLDDLVSRLFFKCKTIEEAEENLSTTAESTLEPDINLQAASAIIESIKPIYEKQYRV